MPRNIEIKARIPGVESLIPTAAALADQGPVELDHDDTFFRTPRGRLKLREFSPQNGELIFYQRPDVAGPKESLYVIAHTSSPAALRDALAGAYGTVGRVRKHRTLYGTGRTRIHLDRVEGLGDFLELEVVLAEDESPESGLEEARQLLAKLGIPASQLQAGAYLDLLRAGNH